MDRLAADRIHNASTVINDGVLLRICYSEVRVCYSFTAVEYSWTLGGFPHGVAYSVHVRHIDLLITEAINKLSSIHHRSHTSIQGILTSTIEVSEDSTVLIHLAIIRQRLELAIAHQYQRAWTLLVINQHI